MSSTSPGDAPAEQIRHFVKPGEVVAGRYQVTGTGGGHTARNARNRSMLGE